jgi:hypothetical protein
MDAEESPMIDDGGAGARPAERLQENY